MLAAAARSRSAATAMPTRPPLTPALQMQPPGSGASWMYSPTSALVVSNGISCSS
jgi:hypothetical protein